MIDPPKIIQTAAQATAVIHLTIPRSEIRNAMGPGRSELLKTLADQGITPAGPWFSHHLRIDPKTFDFEIGVPVDKPVEPRGRVRQGSLPAMTAARTVYHGPYEGLGEAWVEFDQWTVAAGHLPGPALLETYLPESSGHPGTRTELTRPLARQ